MSGFRLTLDGDEALMRRITELDGKYRRRGKRAVERSTELVEATAKEGISSPPKTGRIYTTRFATSRHGGVFAYGSRPPHQASAPGEYPASDTGHLMRSIWHEVDDAMAALDAAGLGADLNLNAAIDVGGVISGVIGADADYAAPLEYKPPGRGGRPFLRRALMESAPEIKRIFREELSGAWR